jgi:tetratricopeptide (TPR) repeat protein
LEEAVATERAALQELARASVPLKWAESQNYLGVALAALGEREGGTARLEEAVAAYRAALEERTRDHVLVDWATTQMNLGNALAALGERAHNTEPLKEALACFEQAGPVLQAAGMAQASAVSDRMIGRLQDALAKSSTTTGEPHKPGG